MSALVAGSCAAALVLMVASTVMALVDRRLVLRRLVRAHDSPAPAAVRRTPALRTIRATLAQRRRPVTDTGEVAAMLERMARRCTSGVSLTVAFAEASQSPSVDHAFGRARNAVDRGASIATALNAVTLPHPDVALAVHVIRTCALQGGAVAEHLDRAASTLRERHAAQRERHAHGAQARLSARVLTVLPLAFGGWTCATTTSVRRFVVTPVGAFCVVAGVALNVAGWLMMSRVVRAAS